MNFIYEIKVYNTVEQLNSCRVINKKTIYVCILTKTLNNNFKAQEILITNTFEKVFKFV